MNIHDSTSNQPTCNILWQIITAMFRYHYWADSTTYRPCYISFLRIEIYSDVTDCFRKRFEVCVYSLATRFKTKINSHVIYSPLFKLPFREKETSNSITVYRKLSSGTRYHHDNQWRRILVLLSWVVDQIVSNNLWLHFVLLYQLYNRQ